MTSRRFDRKRKKVSLESKDNIHPSRTRSKSGPSSFIRHTRSKKTPNQSQRTKTKHRAPRQSQYANQNVHNPGQWGHLHNLGAPKNFCPGSFLYPLYSYHTQASFTQERPIHIQSAFVRFCSLVGCFTGPAMGDPGGLARSGLLVFPAAGVDLLSGEYTVGLKE